MVMRMFSRAFKKDGVDSYTSEDETTGRSSGVQKKLSMNMGKSPVISKKTTTNLNSPRSKPANNNPEGPDLEVAQKLAEVYSNPPPAPIPKREVQMVSIRGARRGGPVEVSDTLSLFASSWNMVGVQILPMNTVLQHWIPRDYDLYAIALQNSRSIKQMQERILEYLGDEFQAFRYILLGQSSLLLFARADLVSTGALATTRLNDLVKFEIKTKSLVGGATGRGCILMQMCFHNTTIAFVAVNLDDDVDGLDRRKQDLDFCLKATGIARAETNEIGMPVLTNVQHVFLLGNFGCKSKEKCQGSSKKTWKGKWSNLLYDKELEEMFKVNAVMDGFEELEVDYPPSSRRKILGGRPAELGSTYSPPPSSPRGVSPLGKSGLNGSGVLNLPPATSGEEERRLSATFISQFTKDFEVEELFDAKLIKKEGEPSFEDRIFYRTSESQKHLMEAGKAGSAEYVRLGTHVPVYSTFSLCGVDASLLKRWQVITGNMPVENATRTDFRMVKGVVDDLLQQLQEKAEMEEAWEKERIKTRERLLAQQRKCDRCFEPLSLEGGDVDLGEQAAFHRKCFTCDDCGKDLLGEKLMLADGKWLCWDSFDRLYQRPCPYCQHQISGQRIRIGMDQVSYHLPCFNCTTCGQRLVEHGVFKSFFDMDGKPYCADDFEKVKESCCNACKKHIDDGDRPASGVKFHKACYVCVRCGQDMDNTSSRPVIKDYKVFCEAHYLKELQNEERLKILKRQKEEFDKNRNQPKTVTEAEEEVDTKQTAEEEEEERRKEQEMMKKRMSMIPKGFDMSNYDVPEDADIEEDDEDE